MSLSNITDAVKDHMNDQPCEVKCLECDNVLDYDVVIDDDLDLTLIIECCTCQNQDAEVDALENNVNELEFEIDQLKAKLEEKNADYRE